MLRTSESKPISKIKFLLFVSLMLFISSNVSYAQEITTEQEAEIDTIEVHNLGNQNPREKEIIKGAIERLNGDSHYRKIVVKDGSHIILFSISSNGKRNISMGSLPANLPEATSTEKVISNISAYPGCEGLAIEERRACNSVQIAEILNKNYDLGFDAKKFLLIED